MSTVVLYCWCHSDSASVLLYFTFTNDLATDIISKYVFFLWKSWILYASSLKNMLHNALYMLWLVKELGRVDLPCTDGYIGHVSLLQHCISNWLFNNANVYITESSLWKLCRVSTSFKGIPGCFFTRTSLLKSSNNLEPICNDVNIKCSWLVILRIIISVTSTFTLWETYNTSVKFTNLIIFLIP